MPVEALLSLQNRLRLGYALGTHSLLRAPPSGEDWPVLSRLVCGAGSVELVQDGHDLLRALLLKEEFSDYSREVAQRVRFDPAVLSLYTHLSRQGRALRGFRKAPLDSRAERHYLKRARGALIAKSRVVDKLVLARNECQRRYRKRVAELLEKACEDVVSQRLKEGVVLGYRVKFIAGRASQGVAVPNRWSASFFVTARTARTGKR